MPNIFKMKDGQEENQVTFFTGDEVSKADGGEGDDNKVDGLKRAPAFYVLKDDCWQGHKDEAAKQDEEQRGDDADLRLTNFPFLQRDKRSIDSKKKTDFRLRK